MLIFDSLFAASTKGLLWVFKEIYERAQEEEEQEEKQIMARLSELYSMLEDGQMSEEEFDSLEEDLLDRLDEIRGQKEEEEEEEIDG